MFKFHFDFKKYWSIEYDFRKRKKSFTVIISYIIISLLNDNYQVIGDSRCLITIEKNNTIATCEKGNYDQFPIDLGRNVNAIIMAFSILNNITSYALLKYPKLKKLDFHNSILQNLEDRVFAKIRTIEEIDFSFSAIDNNSDIITPPNIRIINISHLWYTNFDFRENSKLEKLLAANNNLLQMPNVHPKAPLEYLNFDYNQDLRITPSELIPYCKLRQFEFGKTEHTRITYCGCLYLHKWLKVATIQSNFGECEANLDELQNCGELFFNDDLMRQRYDCLKIATWNWWPAIFGVGFGFVIILIMVIISNAFHREKHMAESSEEVVVEEEIIQAEEESNPGFV